MKKILSIKILSILLLTTISCNQADDSINADKENLIGTWKVKKIKASSYISGELVTIDEITFDNDPYRKLTFNSNQSVTYEDPDLTVIINGTWTLNNKTLKTDLKLDLPATTGFEAKYFFQENNIVKLNGIELILESPMNNQYNLHTETFFEK